MRVLAGVVPASSGLAEVAGIDVAADPLEAKRRSGYCPDVGGLIPRATPWEHLQLSARLRGLRDWEPRARALLDQFDLGGEAHRVTAGFSHGMGRRMSVALAVFHEPPVLLLDEPFDGVDPTGVDATLEAVADARARGAAVILSTHLRDLAVQACDHAVVLRGGLAVASVDANEMAGEGGAVPTGRSSADVRQYPGPVTSLALLLGLRARGLRTAARIAVVVGVALLVAVTVVSVTLPSQIGLAPELVDAMRRYLPVGFLAFVVTTATAVLFGGGGREAIAADQVVAYPLGPTTDHLAGLVLAPLNLAWLLQAWSLLAAVAVLTQGGHTGPPSCPSCSGWWR